MEKIEASLANNDIDTTINSSLFRFQPLSQLNGKLNT